MIRIGLTGVSGSGKSFVTKIFAQYGIPSVNSDAVVHELYGTKNSCTEALSQRFGMEILCEDHSVDRRKLAEIVFSSKEKLQLLNQTVHPFVTERIDMLAKAEELRGSKAFLIEAPQLFEAGLDATCNYIVSVVTDHETRIERLTVRDGITREMAENRIRNQHNDLFFREHSDFCIENSAQDDLEQQVLFVLKELDLLI